jgi:hypothetical protein
MEVGVGKVLNNNVQLLWTRNFQEKMKEIILMHCGTRNEHNFLKLLK